MLETLVKDRGCSLCVAPGASEDFPKAAEADAGAQFELLWLDLPLIRHGHPQAAGAARVCRCNLGGACQGRLSLGYLLHTPLDALKVLRRKGQVL